VVAQPVDWLLLAAMGLSVYHGEDPIIMRENQFSGGTEFSWGANSNHLRSGLTIRHVNWSILGIALDVSRERIPR